MAKEGLHIWVQANKVAAWFLIGVTGILGVLFTGVSIVNLLGYFSADDIVLMVLGLIFLALSIRFARYFLLPSMSVMPDHLIVRPFLGRTAKWRFEDVTGWATETQRIEKDWRGRRMVVVLTVERLKRTDKVGDVKTVMLPRYAGQNEHMLRALAKQSGLEVVHNGPI